MKNGLLLINLGTPENPGAAAVKRYLREFLADKRVLTLPTPLRYLLLYGFILPVRARQSSHAYRAIWTAEGSPLLCHSYQLVEKLQARFAGQCKVVLGMRYGKPTIHDALLQLQQCENITVLPLYPQYSSAATGSSIEKVMRLLALQTVIPSIKIIRDFHAHPSYINAQAEQIKSYVDSHDYILFSYHGVPENHLHKTGCKPICVAKCPPTNNACYRAQCMQTTALVAKTLNLNSQKYSTSFQSRLGKIPWTKPYTNEVLAELIKQGVKRLAIVCPSFIADCLETLEEMDIRIKQQWLQLGGEQFTLIPCLNENEAWLDAITAIADINGIYTFPST